MRRFLLCGLLVACSSSKTTKPAQATGDAGAAAPAPATAAEMAPSFANPGAPGPIPVAECPITTLESEPLERTLDRLLEQAEASFDDQRLAEAFTCADQAADL